MSGSTEGLLLSVLALVFAVCTSLFAAVVVWTYPDGRGRRR